VLKARFCEPLGALCPLSSGHPWGGEDREKKKSEGGISFMLGHFLIWVILSITSGKEKAKFRRKIMHVMIFAAHHSFLCSSSPKFRIPNA